MTLDRATAVQSIRPRYTDAILARTKAIEFRRRQLPASVKQVLIWRTGPGGGIVGAYRVRQQITRPAREWCVAFTGGREVGYGISLGDLIDYAGGNDAPLTGIRITDVVRYPRTVAGRELGIAAPQSWRYAPSGWRDVVAAVLADAISANETPHHPPLKHPGDRMTGQRATTATTYVPDPSLPPAWVVDVDGTLADNTARNPFAWHLVHRDTLIQPVAELVRSLAVGAAIVVMSGREDVCRVATHTWLTDHRIPVQELHMRAAGDGRQDAVVKRELFEAHVAPRWNVRGVIDDRQQVVDMWRGLGLMCAQVAPGNF